MRAIRELQLRNEIIIDCQEECNCLTERAADDCGDNGHDAAYPTRLGHVDGQGAEGIDLL